jgi:LacI family transcriptional regulator
VSSEKFPLGRVSTKPQITIYDVAARAGVAISRISRVLSGHPDVSPRMRLRVQKAVDDLGYEPDLLAQSLRRGATKTIGFIVRDISNPLFALKAQRCEQVLRKAGYSMILMNSDGNIKTESENFSLLRRRRVDGVIASLVSENSPNLKNTLENLHMPLVLLDREVPGLNAGAIVGDHRHGIFDATKDLIQRGHRDIAYISGGTEVLVTRNRLRGFYEAFEEANLPIPETSIALGRFDVDYAVAETRRLFMQNPHPSALMTGGIRTTAGALQVLNELKIKPGKDLAFVAIDEWPMFEVFASEFSSVFRDPAKIGELSAQLILDMLNGGEARQLVVETKYILRKSSAGGLKSNWLRRYN